MSEFRGSVPDQLPNDTKQVLYQHITYHTISASFKYYFGLVQTTAEGANRYQRPFGLGQFAPLLEETNSRQL